MNEIQITLNNLKTNNFNYPEITKILSSLGQLNSKIICLYGEHGAGKDVWAKILNWYLKSESFRFSDWLRNAFGHAGLPDHEFDKLKRTDAIVPEGFIVQGFDLSGLQAREAMQTLAEKYIKPLKGKDFFAKETIQRAEFTLAKGKTVIFVDQRFPEELQCIERLAKSYNLEILKLWIPEDLPKVAIV